MQAAELGARFASWAARPNPRASLGQEECLPPLWGPQNYNATLKETIRLYDIPSDIKT